MSAGVFILILVVAIAALVLMIVKAKMHPVLALFIAALGTVGSTGSVVKITLARSEESRAAVLSAYKLKVLASGFFGAVLTALLGFLLVRRALHKVKLIAQQAQQVSAHNFILLATRGGVHGGWSFSDMHLPPPSVANAVVVEGHVVLPVGKVGNVTTDAQVTLSGLTQPAFVYSLECGT